MNFIDPNLPARKTVAYFQATMNQLETFEPLAWLRQLPEKDFKRLSNLYDRIQDRHSSTKTEDTFITTVLGLSIAKRLSVIFDIDEQGRKEQAMLFYINTGWAIEWIMDEKSGKPKKGGFDFLSDQHLRKGYTSEIPLSFFNYVK